MVNDMSQTTRDERLVLYRQALEKLEELIQVGKHTEAIDLVSQNKLQAENQGDQDFYFLFEAVEVRIQYSDNPRQLELLNHSLHWEDQNGFQHDPAVYLCIGQFYACNNDHATAIAWFNEALKINQADPTTLRLIGMSIFNQGDPGTAIQWFEAAITFSNNIDSASYREKAFAEVGLGNEEQAIESIEKAIELRPDLWEPDRKQIYKLCGKEPVSDGPKLSDSMISELSGKPIDRQHGENTDVDDEDDIPLGGSPASEVEHTETSEEPIHPEIPTLHVDEMEIPHLPDMPIPEIHIPEPTLEPIIEEVKPTEPKSTEESPKQETVTQPTDSDYSKILDSATNCETTAAGEFRNRYLIPSRIPSDRTFWFFLRKHVVFGNDPNQTVGAVPGGGHFLWNRGSGTVIDPGIGFLENLNRIGGSLADIRNVIITQDNQTNLAEVETIRNLLLRANLAKNIRFFLNLGAIQKLSGMLDLNDKSFVEGYLTLHPGASYELSGGGKIKAIPAYHQELKSVDQAVGIVFNLEGEGGESKKIVYSGNTGLFPLTLSYDPSESRLVHVSDKNHTDKIISSRYNDEGGDSADLMVLHFGALNVLFDKTGLGIEPSIKINELEHAITTTEPPKGRDLAEVCSVGELGFLGVREVLTTCKPKFAVVCEIPSELTAIRVGLCEALQKQTAELLDEPYNTPKVVPGDLSLVYDVFADSVYDCVKLGWTTSDKIGFSDGQPFGCCKRELFYFSDEDSKKFEQMPEYYINRLANETKFGQIIFS